MNKAMIRYTVKHEHAEENERYIRAVFEQLSRETPNGLHYASFKLADGVSFVHIVFTDGVGETDPLRELSSFKAFTEGVHDRCVSQPAITEIEELGSYRFFGA
jgi:hypothetical protein